MGDPSEDTDAEALGEHIRWLRSLGYIVTIGPAEMTEKRDEAGVYWLYRAPINITPGPAVLGRFMSDEPACYYPQPESDDE